MDESVFFQHTTDGEIIPELDLDISLSSNESDWSASSSSSSLLYSPLRLTSLPPSHDDDELIPFKNYILSPPQSPVVEEETLKRKRRRKPEKEQQVYAYENGFVDPMCVRGLDDTDKSTIMNMKHKLDDLVKPLFMDPSFDKCRKIYESTLRTKNMTRWQACMSLMFMEMFQEEEGNARLARYIQSCSQQPRTMCELRIFLRKCFDSSVGLCGHDYVESTLARLYDLCLNASKKSNLGFLDDSPIYSVIINSFAQELLKLHQQQQ